MSLVASAVLTSSAQASASESRSSWAQIPTGADIAALFPERAAREGVAGQATLTCKVRLDGMLTACTAVETTPGSYGFDKAALALSTVFRMKMRWGKPIIRGTVVIPVIFKIEEGGPASVPDGMQFGDGAVIVAKLELNAPKSGPDVTCPDGHGRCGSHSILWTQRPDGAVTSAILRRLGQTSGVTLADCVIAKDGAPESCTIRNAPSPAALYATQEALGLMRAAPQTRDGVPTVGARAQIPFEWDLLLAGVKTVP